MSIKETQNKEKHLEQIKRLPLWARWLITSFLIILAVLLVFFLLKPLRTYSSRKFLSAGDNYLVNKKYLHADLAYEKALILLPKDHEILAKRALAKEASEDITKLGGLIQTGNQRIAYESATSFPANETDALKRSKKLIEDGEYQLAIIPAQTATEMDPLYRDAWLYLGIANLKTAQLVELSPEVKQKYLDEAKAALVKAKAIDPESKIVADYLKMI